MKRPPSAVASAATRLGRLAQLHPDELHALAVAEANPRRVAAHREIVVEGQRITEPSIVLSGWACRSRIFADGRRQILSLVLPGDLIGVCRHTHPVAATGMVALTEVTLCPAPRPRSAQGGLTEAYARSGALEEFYLFRHIARLGRLSAYERTVDLFLEIRDRLFAVGIASADSFSLPLSQETLSDHLGLSAVHMNRMLQTLRSERVLELSGGVVRLMNVQHSTELVDYRRAVVAAL